MIMLASGWNGNWQSQEDRCEEGSMNGDEQSVNLQQQICRDILGNNDGVIKPIQIIKFKLNPVNKSFNTDSVCWYNHREKVNVVGMVSNAFNYTKCGKVLSNKSEFMYHKKANTETMLLNVEIIFKESVGLMKQIVGLHMIIHKKVMKWKWPLKNWKQINYGKDI